VSRPIASTGLAARTVAETATTLRGWDDTANDRVGATSWAVVRSAAAMASAASWGSALPAYVISIIARNRRLPPPHPPVSDRPIT